MELVEGMEIIKSIISHKNGSASLHVVDLNPTRCLEFTTN